MKMRKFIFLVIIGVCLSATCPNLCSGHGSCTKSGTCSCYKGYTYGDCSGKICPYGKTYVEPSALSSNTGGNDIHTDLECSGKGNCNRDSGVCECFEGFEGSACQRLSCPNSCSGHGLCVPVKHLTLNGNSDGSAQYEKNYGYAKVNSGGNDNYHEKRYDGEQSYACVCDGEYSGYDCSEKKCPSGYSATSDCEESSSKSTEVITYTSSKEPSTSTAGNGCLAYLEYTDNYGRKWYSDKLCLAKQDDWGKALLSLPVGVIDPDTTVTCNAADACTVATITFGSQQTGRKPEIRVITKDDLETTNKDLYPGGKTPSGYHGMSTYDLIDDTNDKVYDKKSEDIKYSFSGVKAVECAGNGSCNTETGLCDCFTGFYGISCTMTEDMM